VGEQCPIVGYSVNARVVRLNALWTVLLLLAFLFTPFKWVIFVLCADFLLRCFARGKYSVFGAVSRLTLNAAGIAPSPQDAGPKVFAAKIGLLLCVLISVCFLINWITAATVLAIMFLFCAALEAFFGYCLGCKMYSLMTKTN
jgi:hypothetical protein